MYGNKAFLITVDSILAVLLAGLLLIYANNMVNSMQSDAWKDNHLQRYSMDLLTVLEKSNMLETAVTTKDYTNVRTAISETAPSICMLLEVWDSNNVVASVEKQDCAPTGRRRLTTRRTFIAVGDATKVYTAKLYSWYKEA
ncbi:MAG: hypothetical protein J7L23_05305 [Candidatus Diapherotrites archaeon]|nr:hypothetical protein [Candidatus Diapherotrites archaeon]